MQIINENSTKKKKTIKCWLDTLQTQPRLIEMFFWETHVHFLVFEAWFTNAQSHLLGATNVYQMCLYVAHSQSFQLYQMTYVERQKLEEEEDDGSEIYVYTMAFSDYCRQYLRLNRKVTSRLLPCWIHRYKQTASVCRIDIVIVLLLPPRSEIGPLAEAKIWSMESRLHCEQGSMGNPRLPQTYPATNFET